MNKNSGIWITIGSILVAGVLVTTATTNFIKNQEVTPYSLENQIMPNDELASDREEQKYSGQESFSTAGKPEVHASVSNENTNQRVADSKEDNENTVIAEPDNTPLENKVSLRRSDVSQQEEQKPQIAPEPKVQTTVPETVISPKNPDAKVKFFNEPSPSEGAAYYQKHLESLDEQISKIRKESTDPTTYSMKALAAEELKLWNLEQNTIYDAISKRLSEEDKKSLEESQQAWLKTRDTKAEEAAKKHSGGTLEGLEYTASLTESTRARAYELVKEYMNVLSSSVDQ